MKPRVRLTYADDTVILANARYTRGTNLLTLSDARSH